MNKQVATAFERQDYRAAAKLLKDWQRQSPQDPWLKLYVGRLQEVSGKLPAAVETYRQVLKAASRNGNNKLAVQARQGLQRIEATEQATRQQAIAQAKAAPLGNEPGLLVLEPVSGESRSNAAQGIAKVMKIDPYTARMQLPSRGWRLFRVGPMGELEFYGQALQAAGVPVFWQSLVNITTVRVFRAEYFQELGFQPVIVCKNEQDQLGAIRFEWSEVSQQVVGLLPIFEQVVDLDVRNKLQRKEQTQDYVQICDLHLPGRQCLIRFCDRTYQFQQGVSLHSASGSPGQSTQATTRINWNKLLDHLKNHIKTPIWSDFTTFGEGALEYISILGSFSSHIDIFRRADSNWDPAFHLYSSLVFLQS
ncbi:MAG: tetratricopeptide repeat protein [Cyanothece sp. SIO1E1]|nr:tetratricopeptide repeat protein [Cyanothece sp. SIO1E1]